MKLALVDKGDVVIEPVMAIDSGVAVSPQLMAKHATQTGFEGALASVNDALLKSDDISRRYAAEDAVDVQDVVLAIERAQMHLELAVQVRNKVVEGMQELLRMQL